MLTSVEASPTTTEATDVKIDNGEEDDLQGDYFDVPQGVSYDYSGKDYCYFEAPSGWAQANIWAWNGNVNLYSAWPGAVLTEVGQAENGNKVYKWVNDTNTTPANLIFSNNGNTQTDAGGFTYTKGGYYNFDGFQGTVEELTGLFNRVFTKDERSTVCLPFNIKTSEMGSLNTTRTAISSSSRPIRPLLSSHTYSLPTPQRGRSIPSRKRPSATAQEPK